MNERARRLGVRFKHRRRMGVLMVFSVALLAVFATIGSHYLNGGRHDSRAAATAASASEHPAAGAGPKATLEEKQHELERTLVDVTFSTASGDFPGGCTSLVGVRACLPKVTIDGNPVSDSTLLGALFTNLDLSHTTTAEAVGERLNSAAARQGAIASVVLQRLLFEAAVASGHLATEAEATVQVEQALRLFESEPTVDSKSLLPTGLSPEAYYRSPKVIAAFQDRITVQREKDRLAAAMGVSPAPSISSRQLASWLGSELPKHKVLVDGAPPGFSISEAL